MASALPLTCRIKEDVVARAVGDEMILLDLESGTYFTLNAIGALVWRGIEDGDGPEIIVERIVQDYDVNVIQASDDVHKLLSELAQNGLVLRF